MSAHLFNISVNQVDPERGSLNTTSDSVIGFIANDFPFEMLNEL